MIGPSTSPAAGVASGDRTAQYGPRPLPLFLQLLAGETAGDPARRAAALAGLAVCQTAPRRPAPAPSPTTVAWAGSARLLDYGGAGPPALFIPSLINPAAILDLTTETSLLRWLAGRGVRPFLIDWGAPDDSGLDLAGHVEARLAPLADAIGERAALVGYCLGGTLANGLAAIRPVRSLTLLAAPWHFAGYGDDARSRIASLWHAAKPATTAIGTVPMELFQAGFWHLDPAGLIDKYVRLGSLDPASEAAAAFIALEDWANAGAPVSAAAGRDLFERLFAEDVTGRNRWRIGGRIVDPADLATPVLEIVSRTDRIVPQASAAGVGRQVALDQGHVGMIVGRTGRSRLRPVLAHWLRLAHLGGNFKHPVREDQP